MTALSHGLHDMAKTLEESVRLMDDIDAAKVIAEAQQYARRGKALLPLRPVFVGGNDAFASQDWPMINMRAKEAERAAALFQQRKMVPEAGTEGDEGFFDAKEYHTSNK
jgi:hypothetical protein